MFRRLLLPAVAGAMFGAWLLTRLPADAIRPWVAVYVLLMRLLVLAKAFRRVPPVAVASHVAPLGFGGAFIDAIGGGGWGPIVASTLLARGNHARQTIGTVNAVEFFVTFAGSAVFLATLGLTHWQVAVPLGLGGLLAAPLGGWLCKRVPHKPMLMLVGVLIVTISTFNVVLALR